MLTALLGPQSPVEAPAFVAGRWGADGPAAERGGLVVNGTSNFRLDHVPFGGVKDSGFRRESPKWMIEDYTVVKTLLLGGGSTWGCDARRDPPAPIKEK